MKRSLTLLATLIFIVGLAFGTDDTLERYALITGSNLGGKGTAALKYAAGDAKRFQEVLTKLGGLKEENSLLLLNPGKENLLQGLSFLRSKIKKNRQTDRQVQFVFYYSGHSDDRGLLLGGERLGYDELKSELDLAGAEVQIVVLDSCASGAFTRTKGGQIGAPFLKDLSTDVEGHAFLTSSTAEELSQESDRIESSFFTHSLVEGLRGAGDANNDGMVSLNEAYEYAYRQTTSDTQATTSGTQHPAFDIQLSGKGNLVMTDLRSGGATLVFPLGMQGTVTIRDIANKLLAEVQKSGDQELTLGIDEGYYRITWDNSGQLSETTTIVDERRPFTINLGTFQPVGKTKNRTRGGVDGNELEFVPIGLSVIDSENINVLQYNLMGGRAVALGGVMLSLVFNVAQTNSSGFQGSLFSNIAGADFNGVQATFGINTASGDFLGLQNGWIFNGVDGRLSGVQAGLVNHVGQTMNIGQIGALNLLDGDGRYFQIGGWNQALASFSGFQASLSYNYAQSITGVQLGLVNFSEDQTGVQIGLINISKHLNGLPIGIIDIQFNGQNHVDQVISFTGTEWGNLNQDLASTTVFRLGSEYFYKYFSFGTRMAATGTNEPLPAISLGLGLGIRVPVLFPGFALHFDTGTSYTRSDATLDFRADPKFWTKFVPQFRTFVSWNFWQNFGVLAGWDHPVFTDHFHEGFNKASKVEIKTDWGNLYMANRFFLGIQF